MGDNAFLNSDLEASTVFAIIRPHNKKEELLCVTSYECKNIEQTFSSADIGSEYTDRSLRRGCQGSGQPSWGI